ncbi:MULTISPECIES: hypothetical protein [Methanothrix]|nr:MULTISPECIES: hypothetical protein [Methanothrix]MDD5256162.1 hypothetical protein [Methanothrix soehngenii]MDD5735848.1 hypothetical protein [Methanothrix soehngenii]
METYVVRKIRDLPKDEMLVRRYRFCQSCGSGTMSFADIDRGKD